MGAPDKFPTLREELDRKAFETIEWLTLSLDQAKITPAQFSTGVDAMFMSMSGLVDEDVIELITAASDAAKEIDLSMKRNFIKGVIVLTVTHRADSCVFTAKTYSEGVLVKDQRFDCETTAAAGAKIIQLADRLIKSGYTEI